MNGCNLSKNEKLSLEIKKEKPAKPEETETSVKIRRHRRKLETMKSLKEELIKLSGSWRSSFGVYLRKLEKNMSGT